LGHNPTAGAGIIDVEEPVVVLAHQLGAGDEEGVLAAGRGIDEERGVGALAGGDQV
jgi:hypothetical protein